MHTYPVQRCVCVRGGGRGWRVEGVPLGGDPVVRECTPPHTPTRPGAPGDRARTWAGGASRGSPGVGRGALGPPLAWSSQVYGPGAVLNVLGEHRNDVPRAVQVSEAQHGGSLAATATSAHGLHAHPPQRSLESTISGPPAAVGHQRQWCTESPTHPPPPSLTPPTPPPFFCAKIRNQHEKNISTSRTKHPSLAFGLLETDVKRSPLACCTQKKRKQQR
jgi:hypothetical protein